MAGGTVSRPRDRDPPATYAWDLLPTIAKQAAAADRSRDLDPAMIAAIKASPLLSLSASRELGGLERSVGDIAHELEAVAAACGSTAWCLWNHLSVFHLYCGALGPEHTGLLGNIVAAREWVCFPGGAGTRVLGRLAGDHIALHGEAHFGSGARYGEWIGVAFGMDRGDGRVADPPDLRFTIVRRDSQGVSVDPTWDGMSLRASATDRIRYENTRVPAERWAPWYGTRRADMLRRPDLPVIHTRYREDWVGLSDLWLAAQAVGVAQAALDDACTGIRERRAILGMRMRERPSIHLNLGRAGWLIDAARAAVAVGCADVDRRIEGDEVPSEADALRQMTHSTAALHSCDEAMRLILRVLGGNGLREGGSFERRYRDFQAMPLHINAHPDRVSEQFGRQLLGLPLDKF